MAFSSPITTTALLPPNANDALAPILCPLCHTLPASVSAISGKAASRSPFQICAGSLPCGLQRRLTMPHKNAASIAPAAPSVWPVSGLVEVHGVWQPNIAATARLSMLSLCCVPVPCRLIQPMASGGSAAWVKAA